MRSWAAPPGPRSPLLERRRRLRQDPGEDGRRRPARARPGLPGVQDPDGLGDRSGATSTRPRISRWRARCRAAARARTCGSGSTPTAAYSVGTAIRQGRELERLGLAHFEEPLPEHDLPGLREVCRALDIPVSTGEQLKHRWDFRDLIERPNPDILQPDIVDAGGISEVVRIFQLAEVFAKPVMPHCPSAGILLSIASLHAYATVPSAVAAARVRSSTAPARSRSPSCSRSRCCR